MIPAAGRSLCFVGADVAGADCTSLRICGDRIVSIGAEPERGDQVIDLHGDRILPGLINAHDHLQLNNFPRTRVRGGHRNVGEWIDDVAARRESDPRFSACEKIPRDARLWHGGFKNLLAGVTTVAHHDPLYGALRSPRFPVRVLTGYHWAHSLGIDGDECVRQSHRATPPRTPWFIHAGEGIDEAARQEFTRLEALGCVTANARFVHGVAFDAADLETLACAGAGLIWCPASNLYLFGRTAAVGALAARGRVALGSDSRLSGSVDLLAELREAHGTGLVPENALESLVTKAAAFLLGLPDRGELRAGALADLVILPRGLPLWRAARADLRCVMLGGVMSCGDESLAVQLMRAEDRTRIVVDGADKILHTGIAETLGHHGVDESGVQGLLRAGRAA